MTPGDAEKFGTIDCGLIRRADGTLLVFVGDHVHVAPAYPNRLQGIDALMHAACVDWLHEREAQQSTLRG